MPSLLTASTNVGNCCFFYILYCRYICRISFDFWQDTFETCHLFSDQFHWSLCSCFQSVWCLLFFFFFGNLTFSWLHMLCSFYQQFPLVYFVVFDVFRCNILIILSVRVIHFEAHVYSIQKPVNNFLFYKSIRKDRKHTFKKVKGTHSLCSAVSLFKTVQHCKCDL